MQEAQREPGPIVPPAAGFRGGALSPSAMAEHLHRTAGAAALCFAQAMHEASAWANEAWAVYWTDVIDAV